MAGVVTVAVPVPALPALSYRVPDGMAVPPVGGRVRVPLGPRVVTGCVLDAPDAEAGGARPPAPEGDLKDLLESLDPEPYLPRHVIDLALWVAEYYACGPGESLAAAMPPLASGRGGGFRQERVARLTAAGRDALQAGTAGRLGPRQRAALQRLTGFPDGLGTARLREDGVSSATVARLRERGLVALDSRRVERDPFTSAERSLVEARGRVGRGREATAEQRAAVEALAARAREAVFDVALLHGVTGSGKTEVYLRLAREVVAAGRRVLVLVPEIALTPAVTGTFREAFGERVAIQHSALSPGARHDQWHRIRRGEVDVVVGTRSAVFAPLDGVGLVVVDEEHDTSYKQEDSPRYHARSVAIVRARDAGALVVLGSATPSLETFHHARRGRYRLLALTERVHRRPLPDVRVVDMRAEMAEMADAAGEAAISRPLAAALEETLARGEQALILLNRRGFASAVLCRQCGRTFECPNCSVSLTLHRRAGRVRCHYCNYSVGRPSTCAHCAGPYLESVGFGTERIEAELAEFLPDAVVARLDRDAARRRGAGQSLLARFRAREIDVLVGTQMIAKGHDFPNVTLVGVVSADVGLQVADFRAAERTFQLLTQVAGRAGRGERPGTAIVQSFHPEHYGIVHACRQDYGPFFDEEMRYRAALRYPPLVSMVNAVVHGRTPAAAMGDAARMARALRAAGSSFDVLGPAVAPISRLRGRHRAQIFLKGVNRRAMRAALRAALDASPGLGRRVTIDVDPVSLL